MENIELSLPNFTGEILTIREGQAIDPKDPNIIKITGDIKSISNYLKIRNASGAGLQAIDKSKAIVTVNKKEMFFLLQLDPENHFGASVTAKLELSDELIKWTVNTGKTWKLNDLVKFLRFARLDFDVADKYASMLDAYMKFNYKAHIEMEQNAPDRKGNKKQSFNKAIEANLPTDFVLNIPIFKGMESTRFGVEIWMETTEGSANFWFESPELSELIETQKAVIFNEELKSCEGFVIINK
jgi:hypothetical protein